MHMPLILTNHNGFKGISKTPFLFWMFQKLKEMRYTKHKKCFWLLKVYVNITVPKGEIKFKI